MTRIKICGVTSLADARMCIEAGADALGFNFASSSPRCLTLAAAAAISSALPEAVLRVGVFVDADAELLERAKREVGLGCLQLHGDEPPELLARFLPHAYKALRVRGESILAEAARYPGEHLLLDAYVPGAHGGTGARFDWELATALAQSRKLTLAGGLTPENVARAIHVVRPYCVDVASGVESRPGVKDPERVAAFVRAVRADA
jgi:phosphoribosylanthranilate isomerase